MAIHTQPFRVNGPDRPASPEAPVPPGVPAAPMRSIDPLNGPEPPTEAFEATWRIGVRRRAMVILCLLGCWTVVIEARLVQLQVFRHEAFVGFAKRQQQHQVTLPAKRGDIVDRNGELLAYSVDARTVVADPNDITDPAGTAALICGALRDCDTEKRALIARTLGKNAPYAYAVRQVSEQQAQRVADLKLAGITIIDETRRYYPKRDLAAHLLGEVGVDNNGLAGIESVFDSVIRGHKGRMLVQRDARRNLMQARVEQTPTSGATLELTIDQYLQHIAERELQAGVEQNRALGGSAIIMDPQTGEILALANYPTFNPNAFGQYSDDDRRNRAVQDIYEPGSTFKIVTASAALEEGVVTPSDLIDTNPGWIQIGSRKPISDTHEYGVLSFEDVIVKSSNVGAIKTGLRVGAERLDRFVHRYGFGQTLAPDFHGESRGMVTGLGSMNDSALASMSMGYQIGVTPLQMVVAASAVANGGLLMQPHVVRAVITDGTREPVAPKTLRRAVNAETAATLTTFMEEVVKRGTGTPAQLEGFQVAGKTGTAHKVVDGRYSETDFHASFVGFVPSRRPVLTILVVIDTPRTGQYYGAQVAAPIFKRIADRALRQLGVPPTINPTPPVVVVSDPTGPTAQPVHAVSTVPTPVGFGGRSLMPDVRGLGAREAVRLLGEVGLSVHVAGSGVVAAQTPAPGEQVESGGWCALQLRRVVADARPGGSERR